MRRDERKQVVGRQGEVVRGQGERKSLWRDGEEESLRTREEREKKKRKFIYF